MANPIHLHRVLKRLYNRLMTDNVFKNLRPELSSNDLIFHETPNHEDPRKRDRPGGYCVTLVYPIPLLPSGPGGFSGSNCTAPQSLINGLQLDGESGIRTHGGVTPTHAFQACSLNHSDISPRVPALRNLRFSTLPQFV